MKKVIVTTDIKRDKGYLYCCGTDKNGCLTIMQVDRSNRSKGVKGKK